MAALLLPVVMDFRILLPGTDTVDSFHVYPLVLHLNGVDALVFRHLDFID